MKLTAAWADVLKENNLLKVTGLCLAAACAALATGLVRMALRPPLIVERSCFSRTLAPVATEHTAQEIEAFARLALSQRFNSDASPVPGLLSPEEAAARSGEQHELEVRKMTQRVFVNHVKISGDTLDLDTDRLISVGTVRSAFVFPLTAHVASTERTETNPYGLELLAVAQAKKEDSK